MSKHMKRLASPRAWKIVKKGHTWVPKPSAGKHSTEKGVPLGLVLRDYLGIVDTMTEAKRIIGNREIQIDARVATSHKTPVGLMDVVSVPKMQKNYRVVIDSHGRVVLSEIAANQATWKFCRVQNKTVIKGGKLQLNLHDGRNVIVKESNFKTGDVVKLNLPDQKIVGHLSFGSGMTALLTGGSHVGEFAKVGGEEEIRSPAANLVSVTSGSDQFSTIKPYVFLVGKDKSEIALPEVNA
ncbi:MAG TPA: 30S ribosomal protein S4e [Candidatus Thermoplasmatota archaeon]|nr:30S ribosomal protein S4e [Candidatus Thermoplasmatota archaeon]